MERERLQKGISGVVLWTFLSGGFMLGFYIFEEYAGFVALGPFVFLIYRAWRKNANQSPVIQWIYRNMGPALIVQELTVLYCLELIYLILHLEEDIFKRYQLAYLSHTVSFVYAVQQLSRWKLGFLYSNFNLYTTIMTGTGFIGCFTYLSFLFYKLCGSFFQNNDDFNYKSLDGGFLVRFFTLFSLQAMAYYKADHVVESMRNRVISRGFG